MDSFNFDPVNFDNIDDIEIIKTHVYVTTNEAEICNKVILDNTQNKNISCKTVIQTDIQTDIKLTYPYSRINHFNSYLNKFLNKDIPIDQ
jgi:hypothetical protein